MRRLLFLLLVAVTTTTACDNEVIGEVDEDIAGNYDLLSIDGMTLPITFVDNDSLQVEITAAEILMGLNGVFREIDTYRFTRAAGVTTQIDTFTGVWQMGANNTLSATVQTQNGSFTLPATWNGTNTLTFDVDGFDWVWRHR
ncbi:MAG TPA: hypothetical protein VGD27_01445 [Longimicrobiales bacterium]